jgi:hypothetical protein
MLMASLTEHLERQAVVVMESTIPAGVTIDDWRRSRPTHRGRRRQWRPAGLVRRRAVDLTPTVAGG